MDKNIKNLGVALTLLANGCVPTQYKGDGVSTRQAKNIWLTQEVDGFDALKPVAVPGSSERVIYYSFKGDTAAIDKYCNRHTFSYAPTAHFDVHSASKEGEAAAEKALKKVIQPHIAVRFEKTDDPEKAQLLLFTCKRTPTKRTIGGALENPYSGDAFYARGKNKALYLIDKDEMTPHNVVSNLLAALGGRMYDSHGGAQDGHTQLYRTIPDDKKHFYQARQFDKDLKGWELGDWDIKVLQQHYGAREPVVEAFRFGETSGKDTITKEFDNRVDTIRILGEDTAKISVSSRQVRNDRLVTVKDGKSGQTLLLTLKNAQQNSPTIELFDGINRKEIELGTQSDRINNTTGSQGKSQ